MRNIKIINVRTISRPALLLIMVWCILVFSAYHLVPITNSDLFRYYQWAVEYSLQDFGSVVHSVSMEPLPLSLLWIAGKLNLLGIIPALTIAIVYGIALYIVNDIIKRLNSSFGDFVVYTLFILALFPFSAIASNFRNVVAFSVFALAAYRDLVQNKKNILTGLLYIIPCGIHITALLLLGLRAVLGLYKRMRVISAMLVLLVPNILKLLYMHIDRFSFIPMIGKVILKAYNYFYNFDNLEWVEKVKHSGYEQSRKLIFFFAFLIMLLITYYVSHRNKQLKSRKLYENIIAYVEMVLLLSLTSSQIIVPTYFRFSLIAIMLFSVVFFLASSNFRRRKGILLLFYAGYFNFIIYGFASQLYQFYNEYRFIW